MVHSSSSSANMPATANTSPSSADAGIFSLWSRRANSSVSGNAQQAMGSR